MNILSRAFIHRVYDWASTLAERFGHNEREVDWLRTAKADSEENGYSEGLLGVDEIGKPRRERVRSRGRVSGGRFGDSEAHSERSLVEHD